MNRMLKYAWYQLIVIIAAILIAGGSILLLITYWPEKQMNAFIPLSLFALVHFYRVFFPLRAGEIAFDERDEIIRDRATKIAFIVFWYAFILSALLPMSIFHGGSIPVMYLGWVIFAAGVLVRIVWSIAVIVLYSRGEVYE